MSSSSNCPHVGSPLLDPSFQPASLWTQEFQQQCRTQGGRSISLSISRPDGTGSTHQDLLLPDEEEFRSKNLLHLERTLKFLLWSRGGSRFAIEGAPELIDSLQTSYATGGPRAFDADFMKKLFGEELTIQESSEKPTQRQTPTASAGNKLAGNRIGFDLGGSDRKCAALIDGEVVFSEEIPWSPYFETNPAYHFEGIMDSLRRAAAHLPTVDAIGGSTAGVVVDNRIKAASLFRGVSEDLFSSEVEPMFERIAQEWNNVPIRVENDGDVSALAGAMGLNDTGVLGLAMGTSTATGYVDLEGQITPWLSELAFVPIDYRVNGPVDEWSGDEGCAVQYLSQQGVARLIPLAGLPIDHALPQAEKLVHVQEAIAKGDERAALLYQTIGSYLGYTIPQLTRFYDLRQVQLLGRVMSGSGGEIILTTANQVLANQFPELNQEVTLSTPDEKTKRHGQAIAAASLPVLS